MRVEVITSAQNSKIKLLLELQEKSKTRKKEGLFVVEGRRELLHCIEAGYAPFAVFFCPEIISEKDRTEIENAIEKQNAATLGKLPLAIEVPQQLYDKVAYRGGTEGVVAEMYCKDLSLDSLKLKDNPLIVVLESVEKPGNLGAVLRSADASGVDAVIVCDTLTDMYNPNLIRSSIGAIFTVPVATAKSDEAIAWLKTKGAKIYTAQLQNSEWYYDTDMKGATAIVMGTEATGLTNAWRNAADAHIKIPMLGRLDSLNVSVSAAILMYEAVRQRNS